MSDDGREREVIPIHMYHLEPLPFVRTKVLQQHNRTFKTDRPAHSELLLQICQSTRWARVFDGLARMQRADVNAVIYSLNGQRVVSESTAKAY